MASELAQHHNNSLSYFLQHLIRMPIIYNLNLYLNVKNWFIYTYIGRLLAHRLLNNRYPEIRHIYTCVNNYMLYALAKIIINEILKILVNTWC